MFRHGGSYHLIQCEYYCLIYVAVSFHKGCYLGQELTARTHHTGVVRKRILPIQVVPNIKQPIPWGVPIATKEGKPAGKLICCQGGVGLGLMRLEML